MIFLRGRGRKIQVYPLAPDTLATPLRPPGPHMGEKGPHMFKKIHIEKKNLHKEKKCPPLTLSKKAHQEKKGPHISCHMAKDPCLVDPWRKKAIHMRKKCFHFSLGGGAVDELLVLPPPPLCGRPWFESVSTTYSWGIFFSKLMFTLPLH